MSSRACGHQRQFFDGYALPCAECYDGGPRLVVAVASGTEQASQFTTIALRRSRWQVADGPWRYYWRAGAEPAPIMEFTSAICRSIASTA